MIFSQILKDTAFSILDKSKFRGFHCLRDLRFYANQFKLPSETIFDVGANIGQTSLEFNSYFPSASIHAFEPIDSTFELLKKNIGNSPKITINDFALGAEEKEIKISLTDHSLTNSLLREVDYDTTDGRVQNIQVTTGDLYCESNEIDSIFILKTDTEGYDLDVLKGFEKKLINNKIFFILSEVTFDEADLFHTQFHQVHSYLSKHNYTMSNIYDSIHHRGFSPNLHYCNCLWSLSPD